jgi:hypothetical protein
MSDDVIVHPHFQPTPPYHEKVVRLCPLPERRCLVILRRTAKVRKTDWDEKLGLGRHLDSKIAEPLFVQLFQQSFLLLRTGGKDLASLLLVEFPWPALVVAKDGFRWEVLFH